MSKALELYAENIFGSGYGFVCNECDGKITYDSDVKDGEINSCPYCGAEYVLTIKDGKPCIKKFEQIDEDWGE